MFCFNEFAFTVQVKRKINSKQILGFILICLYFTTGHFHTCVLCKERSLFAFFILAQFSATVSSSMGILVNAKLRAQHLKVIAHTETTSVSTRSSAIAEGPRDASCQLKYCQLPRNSAETTYTTSPDQIDGMKLEI